MKKIYLIFVVALISANVLAQSPEMMSYQAVIRDAGDELIVNSPIGMQISILQGSDTGVPVYVETHNTYTNANGLLSLKIGTGNVISGDFASIDWTNNSFFVKTETDPTGGTSYTITGTSQLMSVPYALYAKTSGSSIPGPQGPEGPQGIQGPVGPQGPMGPQGVAGADGIDGVDGVDGAVGPQGPQGIQGPVGPQGPMGPQGIAGVDGIDGIDGIDGAVGPQGPVGPVGPQGPQGIAGVDGADGAGINVEGSDTAIAILIKDATINGLLWISTTAGVDSYGASVVSGDGLVSDGVGWVNAGPIRGPQGIQGIPGVDGIDGATGPTGPAGPQGIQGLPGVDGIDGATGPTGPAGPIGLTGPAGPQGIQGLPGVDGIDGATGPMGPTGPIGLTGPAGPQGIQGLPGVDGIDGATGPMGPTGPIGLTGPAGPQGIQGLPGVDGIDGATGPTGPAGPIGLTGPAGPQGIQGLPGIDGIDGATGPTGPAGPIGLTGPAGPQGIQGLPGVDGIDGATGPMGPTGPIGLTGPAGPQGIQGIPGLPGDTLTPEQEIILANTSGVNTGDQDISGIAVNAAILAAATPLNTPNTIVKRDASGNFNAGVITANVIGDVNGTATNVSGTVGIANGGTGTTTAGEAFDALSPMTAEGDIIYGGTNGTGARLAKGSAGQVLTMNAGATSPEWATPQSTSAASFSVGNIYYTGGDTQTLVSLVPTKILGATTTVTLTDFDATTDNRLQYTGSITRDFTVVCSLSFHGSGIRNNVYSFYIAKGSSAGGTSAQEATKVCRFVDKDSDIGAISLSGIVNLAPGDWVEIWASIDEQNSNILLISTFNLLVR